ncbi:MCE family protein [Spirillospora sp. NPDC029432]|uniref:MCE family protein n=1 Tax=Spirillospora sp. NPDC029432 TaxID=3154599 RepID=UPI003455266A
MTRRVFINLVTFAVLGVVMAVWALTSIIRFDFIDRPYHITVEFQSSPGLHPGFEVDYLGLRIGKIDSVRLVKDKVLVKLDIEKGVKVPQGVSAAAARKSAVGEPVVELTPPAGARTDGPVMKAGAVIPVSRTSVPPKYGDLFGAVIDSLKAIDPNDAQVLTHELAEGWAGRDESLRKIINGGDQLTGTFAENTELLDGLTKDLGRITSVLNQNRDHLGAGVDNLAALTGALSQVRGELRQLRDQGPGLLAEVNGLLEKMGPDFECTVGTLGNWGIKGYNPDILTDLRKTLRKAPELGNVLNNVIGIDQGKPVLNVVFLLTFNTLATVEYKYPLAQPTANKIPSCPDGRNPGTAKQKPYKAKNPGDTIPTHDPSIQGDQRAVNAANRSADDSSGGPPAWLVYVPPVLALLVLVRVMTRSVPAMARLRFRRRKD